jgi:hypothetical protein
MRHNSFQDVVLVCPDNDPESRLILLLAYRMQMCVIRSGQGLGATLERERGDIVELIKTTLRPKVWIVEIPGQEIEARLQDAGLEVVIIDHHSYGDLDRSRSSDGSLLPSSLDQFMTLANVDDARLRTWGFDPIVVHGIAIMDARFVQGLREEGFTHEHICRVLDFRRDCSRAGFPDFDKAEAAAREAWRVRRTVADYNVVVGTSEVSIRGAVSTITIYEDCDTKPLIVVDKGGAEIFVHNVDPSVVDVLRSAFPNGFTFGTGRCWGVNNARSGTTCTLDHILGVLN